MTCSNGIQTLGAILMFLGVPLALVAVGGWAWIEGGKEGLGIVRKLGYEEEKQRVALQIRQEAASYLRRLYEAGYGGSSAERLQGWLGTFL